MQITWFHYGGVSPDEGGAALPFSKGLFPDVTLVLQVEKQHVVDCLLPGKMEILRRKRER